MDARSPERDPFAAIATVDELEAIYGVPNDASTEKVAHRITPPYRALIEHAPFAALATVGPEGLDCSPRGDLPGFIRIHDDKTLLIPDRRGNNRIDSLRNVVRDPRVALMLLIPGSLNAVRINGRGVITADEGLRASFGVDGKAPRSVLVLTVDEIYFQCGRALIRSGLWDPRKQIAPDQLPTPGEILASMTDGRVGGDDYDRAWPERAKASMW
jgi:uncharacterized protein